MVAVHLCGVQELNASQGYSGGAVSNEMYSCSSHTPRKTRHFFDVITCIPDPHFHSWIALGAVCPSTNSSDPISMTWRCHRLLMLITRPLSGGCALTYWDCHPHMMQDLTSSQKYAQHLSSVD